MNSKLISRLALGALLATGAGTLSAQDSIGSRFSLSGSLGLGTDSLDAITNSGTSWWNIAAYNFDFGYTGKLAATTVPFRISLGANYMPGGTHEIRNSNGVFLGNTLRHSLRGYYLAGDLFIDSRVSSSLQFILGASLNKWTVTETDEGVSEKYSIKGIKFGGRFGLDYKVSDNISLNVILQVTELGHSSALLDPMPDAGAEPWNPSWLQFGLKYSF